MARRKSKGTDLDGDMTPMIDMVFQLLIFFMILINFATVLKKSLEKYLSSGLAVSSLQF